MKTEGIKTHWSVAAYRAIILQRQLVMLRERYRVFEIRDRSSSMIQWRSVLGAHVASLADNAVMSLSWDHPLGTSGEEHWPQNMLLYDQPHCCYGG